MTKKTSLASVNVVSNLVKDFNTRKLPQKVLMKKKVRTGKKRYPVRRRKY